MSWDNLNRDKTAALKMEERLTHGKPQITESKDQETNFAGNQYHVLFI